MSFLFSNIRKELKERVDEILDASDAVSRSLDRNTRIMRKLLDKGISKELIDEVKDSVRELVDAERKLRDALNKHIELMEKLIGDAKG